MTNVYFIRHAQATGNLEMRFQGATDTQLTELGREQVLQVAGRLKDIPLDAVYSSPLQRARDTAAGIAKPHGLGVRVHDGLREMDGGGMENLTFDELNEVYPVEYTIFRTEPEKFMGVGGGESSVEVFERMCAAVLDIVKQHSGQTLAVVSHGAALRMFMCFACGRPLSAMMKLPYCQNTAVSLVAFDDEQRPDCKILFDASHLADIPPTPFAQR